MQATPLRRCNYRILKAAALRPRFSLARTMAAAAGMSLDENWALRFRSDGTSLGLSAVFCASGDLIYLFSNRPFTDGATPTTALPSVVRDLLLYEPIVPLRFSPEGFQALSASEWHDLTAVTMASYVGLSTLSSAQESNASLCEEQENLEEEQSESSGPDDGADEDDELASVVPDDLEDSVVSDGDALDSHSDQG